MKFKQLFKNLVAVMLFVSSVLFSVPSVSAEEPLVIGVNLELSGPAAPYSVPAVDALELLVEQVNADGGLLGREVELKVFDNTTDPTEGTSLATRLADMPNVVGVIGPNATSVVRAASPANVAGGLPNVHPATTGDGITEDDSGNVYENVFMTAYEDAFQGTGGAQFVYENLDAKKVALVVDQALDYSQGVADAFVEKYEALGGEVVLTESYQSGDTDFSAIATALVGQDFDVVYLPGYYTEAGLLVKQLREFGVDQPVVGADGFASDTFVELIGNDLANDIYYTTHYYLNEDNPVSVEFTEAYEEKYGQAPDTFAALGYDAGLVLVEAIKAADSADPAEVNKALAETKDFQGVTGTFSMSERHTPVKPALVVEMQGGDVVGVQEVVVE